MPDQSDSASDSSSSVFSNTFSIFGFFGSTSRGLNFASNALRNIAWRSSPSDCSEEELDADGGDAGDAGREDSSSCISSWRDMRFRFPSATGAML